MSEAVNTHAHACHHKKCRDNREQIATAPTDPYFTTDILPFRPDHQELDLICDPPMLHATKPLANEARWQRLVLPVLLLERQQQLSQQSTVLEHRP